MARWVPTEADLKAYGSPALERMRRGKVYGPLSEGILRAIDNATEPPGGHASGPLTMVAQLT